MDFKTPPANVINAMRQRVWLTNCKSERNVFFGFDDNEFRKVLINAGTKYFGLAIYAKYEINISRRKARITITNLMGKIQTWELKFLSRDGLNAFLSTLVLDNKTFADVRKMSIEERLARFHYSSK